MGGIEAIRVLRGQGMPIRILILSAWISAEDLQIARALQVDGYLPKDLAANGVAEAIREVASGKCVISSQVDQHPDDSHG
jgi:DNA-binding NarL/FixJ family response regulator